MSTAVEDSGASPTWFVRLSGDDGDLRELALRVDHDYLNIFDENGVYYASSSDWDALKDSGEVLEDARQRLNVANGAAKIDLPGYRSATVAGVEKSSGAGPRDLFVHPDTARLTIRSGVDPAAAKATVKKRLDLASSDPKKAAALRIFASDDLTWSQISNVYEAVEVDVGGERAMKATGWISGNQIKRLKHSAQSEAVAGDESRHRKGIPPPAKPMSKDEAVTELSRLLAQWLK